MNAAGNASVGSHPSLVLTFSVTYDRAVTLKTVDTLKASTNYNASIVYANNKAVTVA